MSPPIDEKLMAYLGARWDHEAARVKDTVAAMNPRERKLVREAAIMGFVRGAMAGRLAGSAGMSVDIPDGTDILGEVVSACLSMPDLYPTFKRMEQVAVRRAGGSTKGGTPDVR